MKFCMEGYKKLTLDIWILPTVNGTTTELLGITNIPIVKRNTNFFEREKVLFRKENLRLKKLKATTEATNDYGGYACPIFLRKKEK